MVEKEVKKDLDKTMPLSSAETTRNAGPSALLSETKYSWMMEGEEKIAIIPISKAYTLSKKKVSKIVQTANIMPRKIIETKYKKEGTKATELCLTNFRIALLDKNGDTIKDKPGVKKAKNPRCFFFYDKDAFEKYFQNMIANNYNLIKGLKGDAATKSYEQNWKTSDLFKRSWIKKGYLKNAYALTGIYETTFKKFKRGTIFDGMGKSFLKSAAAIHTVDFLRKGFVISFKDLDIESINAKVTQSLTGHDIREGLPSRTFHIGSSGIFIKIKNPESIVQLAESIEKKMGVMAATYEFNGKINKEISDMLRKMH